MASFQDSSGAIYERSDRFHMRRLRKQDFTGRRTTIGAGYRGSPKRHWEEAKPRPRQSRVLPSAQSKEKRVLVIDSDLSGQSRDSFGLDPEQ